MELVAIFVNNETAEGLYSIRYNPQDFDEYERLFSNWNDVEYLEDYCNTNKPYLETEYFSKISVDQIITKIQSEAEDLESKMIQLTEDGLKHQGENLQMLFRPLHDEQTNVPALQESKALVKTSYYPKPILRVYGIRISENTFVITGGAVKLTRAMADHPDTIEELRKIEIVKNFLKKNNIFTQDDIIYYYEQFEE